MTVNGIDKEDPEHPYAAYDDVTLIYNYTDVKRILLEIIIDPLVDEMLKSLPE